MTLKNQIMKLQTYKMFEGEDTVYVERDDVLKLLEQQPCEDAISRQAAIDEIEYELEMINSALDSMTLDFNARERLRQRKGEAREILNSIQTLPPVTPQQKIGHWEDCSNGWICSNCYRDVSHEYDYCPNCGADMREREVEE